MAATFVPELKYMIYEYYRLKRINMIAGVTSDTLAHSVQGVASVPLL